MVTELVLTTWPGFPSMAIADSIIHVYPNRPMMSTSCRDCIDYSLLHDTDLHNQHRIHWLAPPNTAGRLLVQISTSSAILISNSYILEGIADVVTFLFLFDFTSSSLALPSPQVFTLSEAFFGSSYSWSFIQSVFRNSAYFDHS